MNQEHGDRALVERVLRKDPEGLKEFDQWLRKVPRIVTARNRQLPRPLNPEDLEDAIQRTMAILWEKLPSYEGRASLAGFTYRIASFELINAHRKVARRSVRVHTLSVHEEGELTSPNQDPDWQSRLLDLHRALQKLSAEENRIVQLKHYRGRTFDEIGEQMSLSPSQVKSRYYRSLERLQRFLGVDEGEANG